MASISFKGEKLLGSSNYIEWLLNATLFLEINSFMPYINRTKASPNKALYYNNNKLYSPELGVRYAEKLSEYDCNNKKALGALKSIILVNNTERFKDKTDARALFKAIKATYGESSFELLGRYFNRIIKANYNSYKNIYKYTSTI